MIAPLPTIIADPIGDRKLVPVEGGESGAAVFRVVGAGDDLVLKVGRDECAELVSDEIARLRWLADRAPSAAIVASADEDAAAWLLTKALPGVTAGAYIKADRTRAVPVAQTMAEFLRRLHALPILECPFDSSVEAWLPIVRDLVAVGRIDVEDFDEEHDGWSAQRVLSKVEDLAVHARGQVVVHGDYSLGNLILDEQGAILGCIDVGRLGVGDPYRDIFIGWRDLGGFGDEAQSVFLSALGLESLDDDRRELHRALDELF